MTNDKKKCGVKSTYNPKVHIPWGVSLARRGCSNEEIAEAFGITVRTLYRWQQKHEALSHALNESKSQADEVAVDSLYKRACGMTIKEKRTTIQERDGVKTTKIEEVQKELPPDTTALIFFLKNRQPALWRDQPLESNRADSDKSIKDFIAKAGLKAPKQE